VKGGVRLQYLYQIIFEETWAVKEDLGGTGGIKRRQRSLSRRRKKQQERPFSIAEMLTKI